LIAGRCGLLVCLPALKIWKELEGGYGVESCGFSIVEFYSGGKA
jgi:hypothetical protein